MDGWMDGWMQAVSLAGSLSMWLEPGMQSTWRGRAVRCSSLVRGPRPARLPGRRASSNACDAHSTMNGWKERWWMAGRRQHAVIRTWRPSSWRMNDFVLASN